ncbi:MAG: O-methyltransferase, partial [Anaerovoracaceae bacterium]
MGIIHEKVEEYIDRKYVPVNNKLAELREYCQAENIPLIKKDTESLLATLLLSTKPKRILEIGTAVGYSAIYMATVFEDSKIITLERDEHKYQNAIENIIDFDMEDRIEAVNVDAGSELEKLVKKKENGKLENFDFIFFDAAKSHYRLFWDYSMKI